MFTLDIQANYLGREDVYRNFIAMFYTYMLSVGVQMTSSCPDTWSGHM